MDSSTSYRYQDSQVKPQQASSTESKPDELSAADMGLTHALSVDVEDWVAGAILNLSGRQTMPTEAVVRNTERHFELFQEYGCKATWFFLGNVAEQFPQLVRKIAEAGHEIGVHGYHHTLIHQMTPEEFRSELRRAKEAVENAAGKSATGYRAPAFSINEKTWYALDTLIEAGFHYDSSLFPAKGSASRPQSLSLSPSWLTTDSGQKIFEIPLSAIEYKNRRLPVAGGGWMRHFPLAYTKWAFRQLEKQGRPAVTYLHPYEIDSDTAMSLKGVEIPWTQRLRLNILLRHTEMHGRKRQEKKLRYLLQQHRFAPLYEVFKVAEELKQQKSRTLSREATE